jgi:hypothetical protein
VRKHILHIYVTLQWTNVSSDIYSINRHLGQHGEHRSWQINIHKPSHSALCYFAYTLVGRRDVDTTPINTLGNFVFTTCVWSGHKAILKNCTTIRHEGVWRERISSSYSFSTSALDWARPRFSPGERTPGTHCTGGWVGPRAGLDTEARGKITCLCQGIEPRSVVQSVARHYTDWATQLTIKRYSTHKWK